MLISLGIPITDLRDFTDGAPRRLALPNWPDAHSVKSKFVRAFGSVHRRPLGGAKGIGEGRVCDARRAIKFPESSWRSENSSVRPTCFLPRYRRFFFDGRAVGKLEIGFVPGSREGFDIIGKNALTLIGSVLNSRVTGPNTAWLERQLLQPGEKISKRREMTLIEYPEYLARVYATATTVQKDAANWAAYRWCIGAETPIVVIQESEDQRVDPPFQWRNVRLDCIDSQFYSATPVQIELSHCWIKWGTDRECRLWRIRYNPAVGTNILREVRMFLTRLHCEQEVLRKIMTTLQETKISPAPGSLASQNLQGYLIKLARRLIRPISRTFGPTQNVILTPPLLDIVRESQFSADPGFQETLIDLLDQQLDLHPNVLGRVRELLDNYYSQSEIVGSPTIYVNSVEEMYMDNSQNVEVHGQGNIVNVAKHIENVSNTVRQNVSQSTRSNEIKTLMDDLTKQVESVAKTVGGDVGKQMADDLSTLGNEVSREKPRQKWYELSIDGLKSAAVAVGEVGKPILDTVKKLLPLLAALC